MSYHPPNLESLMSTTSLMREEEQEQSSYNTQTTLQSPTTMENISLTHGGERRANNQLTYWLLLACNYTALFVGSISGTLLARFYFMHGGSSRWVATWVQCAGFPLLLIPIFIAAARSSSQTLPFRGLDRRLLALSLALGLFLGINNLLFSWGVSYLPVSTSSLLLSSPLAFNLLISVLLLGKRISFTDVNCVVLLTLSSVLLALGASHDRPAGVSTTQFFLGFLSILGAACLFAIYLPVMEIVYRQVRGFRTVVEMQMVMEFAATAFATAGMAAYGGFKEMKAEAADRFDLGRGAYWATIGATVVAWQLVFMGTAGMVFLTSSLNGGICMAAQMSLNVVAGVLVFGDYFGGQKAVATVLCVWGFTSYLFGEYRRKVVEGREDEVEVGGKETERVGNESEDGEIV